MTPSILQWSTLTAAVNEIKSPNSLMFNALYSDRQPLATETIEVGSFVRGREIAPFVRKGAEGIMVPGNSERFLTIDAPNIRIKRPFRPSPLLFNRHPGDVIFLPNQAYQLSSLEAFIAREMQGMADMITNAEEYLAARSLTGVITYEVADQEVFTITYPKPAANNIILGTKWDDADPTKPRVLRDIQAIRRVAADAGVNLTDAWCSPEASSALINLAETGNLKFLDISRLNAGSMDLINGFNEQGAMYIANIGGIRFWEYGRTATITSGGVATVTPMIRPKFVEFTGSNQASDRVMYYGAIPDMEALKGRKYVGRRFSKSWMVPDPSAMMQLTHSRPLPVPRRADANVSAQVTT